VGTASNGHDRSALINGARAAPLLSTALCLTSVGPPPVTSLSFYPPSPVAICHLSIPPLWLAWPPLLSSPTHRLPRIPFFPHQSLTRRRVRFSCLHPIYLVFPFHGSSPISPLLSSLSLLAITPTIHHVLRAGPLSDPQAIQLFQVAAREVFPIPRAELAGPLSIPRSSY
jgi:hypothetical protein